ncbi:CDP-alcohol phosphatidyltransferase family protein [Thermostaphylospora chromogena]|nr:CDP-alcohol phosphatidyltransferase family protein [Thermostaphylospora chromogena]
MTTYSPADVRAVCKPRDAWWTVLLVDPIACRLVLFLANRTSVTPNQITAVAFLMGMCAAACFATGERGYLALGALFFHLGFIADCVDGKLARVKGNGTVFGLWLDFILDQVRLVVCSFALAFGLVHSTGRPEMAYLAGVIIALDLARYLNGPQMAKVRRTMRYRLMKAMSEIGKEDRGGLDRSVAGIGHDITGEPDDGGGDAAEGKQRKGRIRRRVRKRAVHRGIHGGIAARFPWYHRVRERLLAHRIRTHLISGIEYQMAVFVVAPLMGPTAVPYMVGAFGTLLMFFESLLVYKLWISTRDFGKEMRRLEAQRRSRAEEQLVR